VEEGGGPLPIPKTRDLHSSRRDRINEGALHSIIFRLAPGIGAVCSVWNDTKLALSARGLSRCDTSHFDAQLFIENGTPGHPRRETDGMIRLLCGTTRAARTDRSCGHHRPQPCRNPDRATSRSPSWSLGPRGGEADARSTRGNRPRIDWLTP